MKERQLRVQQQPSVPACSASVPAVKRHSSSQESLPNLFRQALLTTEARVMLEIFQRIKKRLMRSPVVAVLRSKQQPAGELLTG